MGNASLIAEKQKTKKGRSEEHEVPRRVDRLQQMIP